MDDFMPGGNLDGSINPYTGERILDVNSATWSEAGAQELYKQLAVLENRLNIARTLGKVELINQLHLAVESLKNAINEAIQRDAKRPTRKRPNTPEQRYDFRGSRRDYL